MAPEVVSERILDRRDCAEDFGSPVVTSRSWKSSLSFPEVLCMRMRREDVRMCSVYGKCSNSALQLMSRYVHVFFDPTKDE